VRSVLPSLLRISFPGNESFSKGFYVILLCAVPLFTFYFASGKELGDFSLPYFLLISAFCFVLGSWPWRGWSPAVCLCWFSVSPRRIRKRSFPTRLRSPLVKVWCIHVYGLHCPVSTLQRGRPSPEVSVATCKPLP